MVEKLIRGAQSFKNTKLHSYRELFQQLAHRQTPETLFITCSDSRVNPNLITQTGPGEMFIIRNAGNIVPPFGASGGGEGATIEYAVHALGVKDIIVCGHSLCGAMGGLLHPEHLHDMPLMARWLEQAETTRRIIKENYADLEGDKLLTATVEENVLVQLDNLRTHPAVAAKLARQEIRIHGWVYEIQTGQIWGYHRERGQFVPIEEADPVVTLPKARSSVRLQAEGTGPLQTSGAGDGSGL
ncbi:Carbonic anhydrase [compost metagenome]